MRRNLQFVFGNFDSEFEGLEKIRVTSDQWLYVHDNLGRSLKRSSSGMLILLGSVVDPDEPARDIDAISEYLLSGEAGFREIMKRSERLSGKFALLFLNDDDILVWNDAQGLFQVYCFRDETLRLLGSSPLLFQEVADLQITNTRRENFFNSSYYQSGVNKFWPGFETLFDDVCHLRPNHYYSVRKGTIHRFWPLEPIERMSEPHAIDRASQLLEGSLDAFSRTSKCAVPVTSGWDSRLILAASRKFRERISYFVIGFRGMGGASGYFRSHENLS